MKKIPVTAVLAIVFGVLIFILPAWYSYLTALYLVLSGISMIGWKK